MVDGSDGTRGEESNDDESDRESHSSIIDDGSSDFFKSASEWSSAVDSRSEENEAGGDTDPDLSEARLAPSVTSLSIAREGTQCWSLSEAGRGRSFQKRFQMGARCSDTATSISHDFLKCQRLEYQPLIFMSAVGLDETRALLLIMYLHAAHHMGEMDNRDGWIWADSL